MDYAIKENHDCKYFKDIDNHTYFQSYDSNQKPAIYYKTKQDGAINIDDFKFYKFSIANTVTPMKLYSPPIFTYAD